jgi:hypothetical protein
VTQDFDAAQQHYLQAAKILDFIESLAASTWRARAEELAR